jgi:hypothetical protein
MATSIILDDVNNKTRLIEQVGYPLVQIKEDVRAVGINEILPFRVRFTAIQIEDIRGNVPAIPLQVIGYSNYIL